MIRIVYFGTAEFAVAPLRALLDAPDRFDVVAVVSRPDMPAGRKQALVAAPVAAFARERGITLFQPTRLKDPAFTEALSALAPDVSIVASYGRIIPQSVLDIPKIASVNLHGSLLPKYRGASPIQAAILAGETVTGVSFMVMDAEVDHGPVISMIQVPIASDDTHDSLERKLGMAGADLLVRDLEPFCSGVLTSSSQDHDAATFTGLISKNDGVISWSVEDAVRIERKTRAYSPWPGAHFTWIRAEKPIRIKVLRTTVIDTPRGTAPGTAFAAPSGNPAIAAKNGAVELLQLQPEGKSPMTGTAFLNGYRDFVGVTL